MSKEKSLVDKIIFIDNLLDSTFSKKTYLYFRDIIAKLDSLQHNNDYLFEENERLNNIIERLEEDLREMYIKFGKFSEEYTENRIRELERSDKE